MTIQTDGTDKNGNYNILSKHVEGQKLRRIIDIGAWWGPWSLHWQPHAEKLEIFEPNNQILPMLEHNISTYNNCTLHKTALGETEGTVSMQYDTHSGTNHITESHGDVEINTLDSYNFGDVDVIKIDVDGFEIPLLTGAIETLTKNNPVINIEMKESKRSDIVSRSRQILENYGYKFHSRTKSDEVWMKS